MKDFGEVMDEDQEDQLEEKDNNESGNELVLDNWKLILIFFVALVICVIFFAAGLIVGRHQPRVADSGSMVADETARPGISAASGAGTTRQRLPSPTTKETVVRAQKQPEDLEERVGGVQSPPATREFAVPPTTIPPAVENPPMADAKAARMANLPESSSKAPSARESPLVKPADREPAKAENTSSVFRVQIAAMKTSAEAQAVVEKLKKKGFEAFIVAPKSSTDTYYRVQMGDYADRAAAQEIMLKLQQAGEKPVLKRQ
jgi:cell division septation protein DedD